MLWAPKAGAPPKSRSFACTVVGKDRLPRMLARNRGGVLRVIPSDAGRKDWQVDDEPPGGRTLAEYSPAAKNRISHRGRAARAMRRELERLLA